MALVSLHIGSTTCQIKLITISLYFVEFEGQSAKGREQLTEPNNIH